MTLSVTSIQWTICIVMSCLLVAVPAQAADTKFRPKPGLWEIDSQTALFGHVVPDVGAVVALGPAALQEHVGNMLRQNRVQLMGDGTARICLSAEQIASNVYANDYGSGCIVGKGRRTGNTLNFDITCGAPKGTGFTRVNLMSKSFWRATTHLELVIRGMTQDIDNISYGRWISATCPAGL